MLVDTQNTHQVQHYNIWKITVCNNSLVPKMLDIAHMLYRIKQCVGC